MNPLERARLSLRGLSVGDALGERFFGPPEIVRAAAADRTVPPGPWRYTDDTEMALSVVETLETDGRIDADALGRRFAARYHASRGYGAAAHRVLRAIAVGAPPRAAAAALFEGEGSYGNGSAMRVAPVGAWFADDLDRAAAEAAASAVATHAHPEGIAGAVAVAVAAAVARRQGAEGRLDPAGLFSRVLALTPPGDTRDGIVRAEGIRPNRSPEKAAEILGSGGRISCPDTVPFCLWCAARHLDSFEDAFWTTVAGLGDRDTTCAIVGGIVALSSSGPPDAWVAAREPLPPGFE
jgi:ADP-ribosylglycohydrolase